MKNMLFENKSSSDIRRVKETIRKEKKLSKNIAQIKKETDKNGKTF